MSGRSEPRTLGGSLTPPQIRPANMHERIEKLPVSRPSEVAHLPVGARGPQRRPARYLRGISLAALLVASACGPKTEEPDVELQIWDGLITAEVKAGVDTVMQSTSRILVQEGLKLQRYQEEAGIAESSFIDLANYPSFFDKDLWDPRERMVKLRFYASQGDSTTLFQCEPLYSPSQIITDEADAALLQRVPAGHPGFQIAALLTRRIVAQAEGRVVAWP